MNISTQYKLDGAIATVGGFIGIFAVIFITRAVVGDRLAVYIIPSLGATAVLLFALPKSPLAQPWNVLGGHLGSAIIGVMCAQWIPDMATAGAVSVGLAMGYMHFARCTHPPGGATALAAVIGGAPIHALGYGYVLSPVLINVLVILVLAVVVNSPFAWRRYPMNWGK